MTYLCDMCGKECTELIAVEARTCTANIRRIRWIFELCAGCIDNIKLHITTTVNHDSNQTG